MIARENSLIHKNFHENSHYRNGYFQVNGQNHIKDEFVKIREFILAIIICDFPSKMAIQA